MNLLFTKMHGLGNNYVFINLLENSLQEDQLPELARHISNVNYGIGSDGMILICPSQKADFRMRIFNADGSEGKNCGNGIRCTATYVFDHGFAPSPRFTIETWDRIIAVEVNADSVISKADVRYVMVDMGEPALLKEAVPVQGDPRSTTINEVFLIEGQPFHLTCLSMGNPHAILFVEDVNAFPLEYWGPKLEHADYFPERVNFGIVHVKNSQEIDYRVWERGSGITMACGTGACAAVVAATLNQKLEQGLPITVHLPGGDLTIRWDQSGHVWKQGPAAYVCSGELAIS